MTAIDLTKPKSTTTDVRAITRNASTAMLGTLLNHVSTVERDDALAFDLLFEMAVRRSLNSPHLAVIMPAREV